MKCSRDDATTGYFDVYTSICNCVWYYAFLSLSFTMPSDTCQPKDRSFCCS